MQWSETGWLVLVLTVSGVVTPGWAAEFTAQPQKPPTTPTSAPAIPALTYGMITALDLASPSPSVTVTTEQRQTWVVPLDPTLTLLWRDGQMDMVPFNALKVGEQVEVSYGSKGAKHIAKAILILGEPLPPPRTTPSATASATAVPPTPLPRVATAGPVGPTAPARSADQATDSVQPSGPAEGIITALTLEGGSFPALYLSDSSVELTTAGGHVWTFTLSIRATAVWKNGQQVPLDQLALGDQVTVRYMEKHGEQVATTIEIVRSPIRQPTPMHYGSPAPIPTGGSAWHSKKKRR